jgi:hypothetical protein
MSYKITAPLISQHEAEEFGKWLAKYKVEIGGLRVYQIDTDGKAHRDDATMKTIKDTVREVGLAVVITPVAIPLAGLIPPVAAIMGLLQAVDLAALGVAKKAQHSAHKREASAGGKDIMMTEVHFDLVGVSAKRRKWSEYLLSIYAALHQWHKIDGMQHPEQWAVGASYAARTGGYPPAWSEQPKSQPRKAPARSKRPQTSRTTITKARRALWRIMDEI